ncbi:MAG: hypothetical protein RLZZ618_3847 [Pseudomonadota bacterium]|jgi:ABC-type branched-subunit amino acid transport system substrate-binding protein
MNRRLFLSQLNTQATALGAALWLSPSWAAGSAEAISGKHINIGTSLALSGALANAGKDHVMGINAAFNAVNKAGGIHGRELRLIAKDDGYSAERSALNVKAMLDQNEVFALISQMGTATTAAVLPMVEKNGVPLVGPITGSGALRRSEFRNVFHVRPSYKDEVNCVVEQMVQMGLQNIAFVYLDNSFGKEILKDAQAAMATYKLKGVVETPLALDGSNARQAVEAVIKSKASAVFLAATGSGVTDFVLAVRKSIGGLPMVGLSVTFSDLARLGQSNATGLAMAMVFPSSNSKKYVLVRDYLASMEASRFEVPQGSGGMESWINAQVLIEGVRRAGRDLNRDKLRASLASMRGFNVGELSFGFSQAAPFVSALPVKIGVMGADFVMRA